MNPSSQPSVHETTILDYGQILLRHWKLILLICVPAIVAAAVWSLVVPPTYQATASIVPPLELMQGGSFMARGLLGGMEGAFLRNIINSGNVSDIYAGILESRVMADLILGRFNLMEVYELPQCRWRAIEHLAKNTRVRVRKEGIVDISVVDRDPNRAAALANAYVEELDRQNKRLSTGQATGKRIFLENRLKEIEAKFTRIDSMPSHEAQVQKLLYELLIQECEMAKIEEAKSMPTIQILDRAVPPERRYKPKRKLIVLQAAAASFAMAALLAFTLDLRQGRKRGGACQECEPAA